MFWRALAALTARLPWRWLGHFGAALGLIAGGVLRIRRRHVETSLRRAGFRQVERHASRMYRSLGTGLFELLWMAGRREVDLRNLVAIEEADWAGVQRALARGKGLVVATAHAGNWDLAACAVASRLPLTVITKHLSWRSLDRFWQTARARRGVSLADSAGATKVARDALSRGDVVAFLIDQAPERRSGTLRATFLGRPARHDMAFALLAARHGAPVAVALSERLPDGTHRVRVPVVIEPCAGPLQGWVREATKQANQALERFIERRPDQWLWLHRRWKGV